ncbi:PKD domain-containing protein [Bacteroidia bacterium]|nr:PKD domain-containing protein [Bacteroidia bacterium]
MVRTIYTILFLCCFVIYSKGQAKLDLKITLPSSLHLCTLSDYIELEVRNISASTVSGITAKLELPTGLLYQVNSLVGTNVSESSITNLNKPEFDIPNLSVTQSATFKIKLNSSCNIISFLNNGGLARIKNSTYYMGGLVIKQSTPINIKQPALQISTISNQLKTADLEEIFIRNIVVKNNGSGKLATLKFIRDYSSGLDLLGTNGGTVTSSGNRTTSILNSADFTSIGNNDTFFDLNETFTFRDTIQVNSCSNLTSKYILSWGCGTQTCVTRQASANVSISSKVPKLSFTPTSSFSSCLEKSNINQQSIVITNNGDDTATAIDINIYQSYGTGFYANLISKIETNSFTYQTTTSGSHTNISPYSTSSTNNSGVFAGLGADPKGQAFLKLPNIAPNKSIILHWKTTSICPSVCYSGGLWNQRWRYEVSFKNQCGKVINSGPQVGSQGSYQRVMASNINPTDITDGQKQKWEYTINTGYLFSNTNKSQLKAVLILPNNLTHSKSTSDLKFEFANGTNWFPNSFTQSGDTVTAYFDGKASSVLHRSELFISLTASCGGSSSSGNANYSINLFYNPDTTCSSGCDIPILCDSDNIRIHCSSGCNGGMHFNYFNTERESFGLPDNNNDGLADNTGSLDDSKIKKNRIMFGDTLLTTFGGKVHNAGSIANWSYGKAISKLNNGRYLSLASAELKIYRNGNLVVTCNNVQYTSSSIGNNKTFTFDVGIFSLLSSGCSIFSSYLYNNSDSLALDVRYVVDENVGNRNINLEIESEFYLSTVANPSSSQKHQCDSFSARTRLIGSYFTNAGRNNLTNKGCNTLTASQNFYLSIGPCCTNYAGGNVFPYEYRKWAKLSEIILTKSESFDVLSSSFLQYRTKGTGGVETQRISSISPYFTSSTVLKFKTDSFYKDLGGTIDLSDDGFHGTFTNSIMANCKANSGLSTIEYAFVYERMNGLGSSYDTIVSANRSDLVTYDKPTIDITVVNNDVYPEKDTVEWELRVTNTSSTAEASNVWIGAISNSNTEVVAIYDTKAKAFLPRQNNLFKLGILTEKDFKNLKIFAKFNDCNRDSVDILLGFDCQSYPDSIEVAPCESLKETIYFEPINTRIEASILGNSDPIDLCAKQDFEIELRNAGSPKIYNVNLDLILRPGTQISDTAWLFVDGRSDSTLISNPIPLGSNVYRWQLSEQDSILKQNGFNGVKSNNGYKMTVKIAITTDCDFTSSSSFMLRPSGTLKCGKPVNAPIIIGDPINIKNVSRPYFSAIDLQLNHLDVCNYKDSTFAKFINLGPDSTTATDQFIISLPNGVYIDTNFIDTSHNSPTTKPIFANINGENTYSWHLPSSIIPGDSSIFKIKTFLDSDSLSCGTKRIYATAVITQPAFCVSSNLYCDIKVSTASLIQSDSVEKSIYDLQISGASSQAIGTNEQVALNYAIQNSGSEKSSNNLLEVFIYADQNSNGSVDLTDSLIAVDSIYQPIGTDSSLLRQFLFSIGSDLTCNLLLNISSQNCACNDETILVPTIRLLNAGRDTIICQESTIELGTEGSIANTYSWNNINYVEDSDSSSTAFKISYSSPYDTTIAMVLTTSKATCSSQDTVNIIIHPGMQANLVDTSIICEGGGVLIGKFAIGGKGTIKQYRWTPTDSLGGYERSAKTLANPSKSTTYSVTITDANNCSIRDSTHVRVIPNPQAAITMADNCASSLFKFSNSSIYYGENKDSTNWTFSELGESNLDTSFAFLDSSRILPVSLFVSNKFGCWDTVTKNLEVYPLPEVLMDYTETCEETLLEIESKTTISYGSLINTWELGSARDTGDIIHTLLPNEESLIVLLKSTSDFGCVSTAVDTITILDKPDISFTTLSSCLNDSIFCTITLLPGTIDAITDYDWRLGDGNTKSDSNFNYTYSDTGTYRILVQVGNKHGCLDTAEYAIQVYPLPESSFTIENICLGDSALAINASAISNGTITSIEWDLEIDKGRDQDSMKFLPTAIGVKSIKQKVESEFGCLDSSIENYTVYHKEKNLYTQLGKCENESIVFTATPVFQDSVVQTRWTLLTDTFIQTSFSYNFTSDGSYSLKQQIITNRGCISDSTFTIVIDPAPEASISTKNPCMDNQTELNSANSYTRYAWILEDGTTNSNQMFTHAFTTIGTYTIDLEVENQYNCKDTDTDSIIITNIVVPDFTIDDICENDIQWIINTTQGNIADISSATFNMDNGDVVNELDSFEYAYDEDNIYSVSLNVTTLPGCDYRISKSLVVHPLPIADFQLSSELVDILNSEVQVTNQSIYGDSIIYHISDGNVIIDKNFSHRFLDSGSYEIKQWVQSMYGCMDSLTKELYVSYAYNLYIPNAFSPNDDRLNDEFKPVGLGLISYELQIYTRWGEQIFKSDSKQSYWKALNASPGLYLYTLKAIDFEGKPHYYKGTVRLLR